MHELNNITPNCSKKYFLQQTTRDSVEVDPARTVEIYSVSKYRNLERFNLIMFLKYSLLKNDDQSRERINGKLTNFCSKYHVYTHPVRVQRPWVWERVHSTRARVQFLRVRVQCLWVRVQGVRVYAHEYRKMYSSTSTDSSTTRLPGN